MMYSAAVLGFNQSLGRSVREWTNLETSLAAISRVKTFSETTASERDCGVTNTTPSLWPSGNIVLKNQSASYNGDEMPPGLNDISFEVSAGQEIGICGRTGSGESYLLLAMLRLMHLSSGSITIDGVIVEIPLQKLRSSITTYSTPGRFRTLFHRLPRLTQGAVSSLKPFSHSTRLPFSTTGGWSLLVPPDAILTREDYVALVTD
jgi:ABC-type multidrug transport system fused ATPase/permease subunit